MIVKRFYDIKLAQTSYLIGCGRTGSAVVIDPNRDVDQYIRAAEAEGVTVTHVTETHIHADFVSGARELAKRTGATLYLSDEGDANWKYAYAREAGAVLVRDGSSFMVGNVRVEVVHTPGHTPEHISFLITDTAAADEPIGIVTGDFVFVGDVGRPDLLEKAAGITGTMDGAARALFRSLEKFKAYPDWLQIWPGHGAGSACGKGLSAVPHSTVGYERRFNWAFSYDDEDAFVQAVLAGQPEPPKYFAEMKRINKAGPALLGGFRTPPRLALAEMVGALRTGAMVIDTRDAAAFAAAHIPGTVNIPLNNSFNTWAGWLVAFDREFYLIAEDEKILDAVRDLAMIGLDAVAGVFDTDVINAWFAVGKAIERVPQMAPEEVARRLSSGEIDVLDVRGKTEWESGHLPGSPNIPLGYLTDRLSEIPRDKPLAVYCQAGARSAIAVSLLRARGVTNVINMTGGFEAWERMGDDVAGSTGENSAPALHFGFQPATHDVAQPQY
jgi:hydroxyacylglutathione hydrolase